MDAIRTLTQSMARDPCRGREGDEGLEVVVLASEAVPPAKTRGLADVAGTLPGALERLGHRVTLILPAYRHVWGAGVPLQATGLTVQVPVGTRRVTELIHSARLPGTGVRVTLIDQPGYFDREGLYGPNGVDYPDNCARFAFFGRAALEAIRRLGLRPDVLHCNDWQTGLVPLDLDEFYRHDPALHATGTLLTIHNPGYQGNFDPADLPLTGLDGRLFNWQQLEFYGHLSFLKEGLVFAALLNTVSPANAREIQTPEFGFGLDGLLRARASDLRGIVNGIDSAVWNPAVDPYLVARFEAADPWSGKAACKAHLQRGAGLPERPEVPLFAQIGRLDPQKGWDLLARPAREKSCDHIEGVADVLLSQDVQCVVLGTGQPQYHEVLGHLARKYPTKLRVFLEFSDALAHEIVAGADVMLMPSLYEPCGLTQLYSLAYGTVSLVRGTGGLGGTVVDTSPRALEEGRATGLVFRDRPPPGASAERVLKARERAMRNALFWALALWQDRPTWRRLVQTGMRTDWSWDRSAREYDRLYREIRRRRIARVAG